MTKGKKARNFIIIFSIIVLAGIAGFFGYQYFTKTGIFHIPGKIIYAEDIEAEIQTFLDTIFSDVNIELEHDVTIKTFTTTKINSAAATNINEESFSTEHPNQKDLLYNIYVPVTDFYNPISNINDAEITESINAGTINLIPISELTNTVKLLAIDNDYYLDTFDSGAFFDCIRIDGDNSEDVAKIVELIEPALPTFPSKDTVLTFAQTGVTALSRGMNAKLDQVGDASYFATNIGDFLSSFDLTHTSNESSFTSTAGNRDICSKPGMLNALTAIGLDIVELTGNHNQDCGDEAAIATIEEYQSLGMKIVGGGTTAETAAEPLLLNEKNSNITMLGYNLSTGGYTLDNTPGANFYTKEKASADIAAAKARDDFIIVDIQYYECNNYDNTVDDPTCDYANSAAGDQIGFFRELIDMGADVIVGTAAHQPQTYELYGNGVIYYGLGNLFFDQYWWPGTQRSLILVHYFYEGKLLQTRIIPTIYDAALQTRLMDAETATQFINRLNQARPAN